MLNANYVNPQYLFRDLGEKERSFSKFLPTSALSYDGLLLEEVIDGYQTLTVTGREMLSVDLTTEKSNVGSIITHQGLPAREITVKYKLTDRNPQQLQRKFKQLLRLLYREADVPIYFKDEPGYTYFGRYSAADSIPGDTNNVVSSYTIYCQDPLKYSPEYTCTDGHIVTETSFITYPTLLRVELKGNSYVTITNGRETISLSKKPIKNGDVLEFYPKLGELYVNETLQTKYLDLGSQFKSFSLRQGDVVTCNNGDLMIQYRGVSL